jgi:hypothetical protein
VKPKHVVVVKPAPPVSLGLYMLHKVVAQPELGSTIGANLGWHGDGVLMERMRRICH